jgi:hypothetical protein
MSAQKDRIKRGPVVSIEKQKLVLVEGRDEQQLFDGLLVAHLGRSDVQVLPIAGKTKLAINLLVLAGDPAFRSVDSLMIVRDADHTDDGAGAASSWQSVGDAVRRIGLAAPVKHAVFSDGTPRVAVFLMPDGNSDGMLEDLCRQAAAGDKAAPCVDKYFENLAGCGIQHAPKDRAKAWAHAFLASRPEPDLRVGEAAQKGYWPFDAPAFAPLVNLLKQL